MDDLARGALLPKLSLGTLDYSVYAGRGIFVLLLLLFPSALLSLGTTVVLIYEDFSLRFSCIIFS